MTIYSFYSFYGLVIRILDHKAHHLKRWGGKVVEYSPLQAPMSSMGSIHASPRRASERAKVRYPYKYNGRQNADSSKNGLFLGWSRCTKTSCVDIAMFISVMGHVSWGKVLAPRPVASAIGNKSSHPLNTMTSKMLLTLGQSRCKAASWFICL